jgi:hypothetical protein
MPFGQPFGQRFVNPMSFEEWLEWQGGGVECQIADAESGADREHCYNSSDSLDAAYQEYVKHYNDDLTIKNFEKGL